MTDETSPAVKLRANVVLLVVVAIIVLAVGLYGSVILLVAVGRTVPGELWLAAGNVSGALITLLVNTKHDATVQDPAPVQVVNQADDPVPVDPAPEPPVDEPTAEEISDAAEQPEPDPEPDPAPKQRRR